MLSLISNVIYNVFYNMYLSQKELISMCIFKFGLVRLNSQMDSGLVLCGLWCLRPFSIIIQLHRGGQFYR